jgi:hypothetical protein
VAECGAGPKPSTKSCFDAIRPMTTVPPDLAECRTIAHLVRRTPDAVLAQWSDARSVVLGHKHDASKSLVDYVVRRGWA